MNEIGIISEVREDKAKVAIGSMVTDFLPVFQAHANSYAVSFSPIRAGEQVLVLPVRGSLNSGVVLRGLYQNKHKASDTDTNKAHVLFSDGVKISYDVSSSNLEISSPKAINITCENVNLTAQNVNVKANSSLVESSEIKLLGNTLIQGAISTFGDGGQKGVFKINGDLRIAGSISADGDASFGGSVSDGLGSLSDHTNNGYARD